MLLCTFCIFNATVCNQIKEKIAGYKTAIRLAQCVRVCLCTLKT